MGAVIRWSIVVGFWILMNVLLWQREYRGAHQFGTSVSPERIWEKILTAPDDSMLEIRHRGKRIGDCRWLPQVAERLPEGTDGPEGLVVEVLGYSILLDGNVRWSEQQTRRLRFNVELTLEDLEQWNQLNVRLIQRPRVWELEADSGSDGWVIRLEDDGVVQFERRISLDSTADPQTLLKDFGLGAWAPLLAGLPGTDAPRKSVKFGTIAWRGYQDSLRLGSSRLKVFRLEGQLVRDLEVVFHISRVGEILRAEFPGDVVLVNEALVNMGYRG